jgi:hypothetical protein
MKASQVGRLRNKRAKVTYITPSATFLRIVTNAVVR